MKLKNYILALAAATLVFPSCEDVWSPGEERFEDMSTVKGDPLYAQGLLGCAISNMPFNSKSVNDVATDDATTNDKDNNYLKMTTGGWNSSNSPVDMWAARRVAIQYVNTFLPLIDEVKWADDPVSQAAYCTRLRAEAYAMRGLQQQYLLMAHAGKVDGVMMGYPILLEAETVESDFNQPRNTFRECYDQIMADYEEALKGLPFVYKNFAPIDVPEQFRNMPEYKNEDQYNRACGQHFKGRINGLIVRALRAQLALTAASPAFAEASGVTYAEALKYMAEVIKMNPNGDGADGGVAGLGAGLKGLSPTGNEWYASKNKQYIENLLTGACPAEIIFRGGVTNGTADWDLGLDPAKQNFPPSFKGRGRINPSQNLVDAFPFANGEPFSTTSSQYDPKNPYANRDPRLEAYIIYDGATYKDVTIKTAEGSDVDNAIGAENGNATRTGYYLKKLLRDDCSLDPQEVAQKNFPVHLRYTEFYLGYAEAANEAVGPTADGGAGCSAYEVIKAIRQRGGITGDAYLESIKTNKDAMRALIRNERRIELCFENKRFWDLRRWNDVKAMNEPIYRMTKAADGTYGKKELEKRSFPEYMLYPPIPKGEVTKWSNLRQNDGWQ